MLATRRLDHRSRQIHPELGLSFFPARDEEVDNVSKLSSQPSRALGVYLPRSVVRQRAFVINKPV